MAIIAWNPAYSVKVAEIDKQHQELVKMLNELFEAMSKGKGQDVLKPILTKMANYTVTHFGYEEKLMGQHQYPESPDHKAQHVAFIAKVTELMNKVKSGNTMITMEVGNFLKEWLVKHIGGTDKKFGAYLNTKGVV